MRHNTASITQWLSLPAICSLCKQYFYGSSALCSPCIQMMPVLSFACTQCATPLPNPTHRLCGNCIVHPPKFDRVVTGFQFTEPLRSLVHQFKYHNALYLKKFLAQLMLTNLRENPFDIECLVPVPMHAARIRQRGFNPAVELSKILAKKCGVPLDLRLCSKTNNTENQANLRYQERVRNLKNCFTTKPNTYRHVTLVDDILTTGSTANELADGLKASGVTQVSVWCLARTF